MKKYIESISKLNSTALSASEDEIDRYAEADIFWTQHKDGSASFRNITKGDIFQFEFGKNYVPEMSYEHRGLIIGMSRKLLYVLPIYSYKAASHKTPPLHITDNPAGKSEFYLLKQSEFPFLKHDSVVKLNDIRTVSDARIKYAHHASIPPDSAVYQFIETNVFRRYFPSVSFAYTKLQEEHQNLLRQYEETAAQLEELKKRLAEN